MNKSAIDEARDDADEFLRNVVRGGDCGRLALRLLLALHYRLDELEKRIEATKTNADVSAIAGMADATFGAMLSGPVLDKLFSKVPTANSLDEVGATAPEEKPKVVK